MSSSSFSLNHISNCIPQYTISAQPMSQPVSFFVFFYCFSLANFFQYLRIFCVQLIYSILLHVYVSKACMFDSFVEATFSAPFNIILQTQNIYINLSVLQIFLYRSTKEILLSECHFSPFLSHFYI